jgi:hypothetical protein
MQDQREGDRKRLLILSCSARKHVVVDKVTAWELYDGVAFRMIKKMQREGQLPNDAVDILILSAQHGLIRPNRKIAFYNRRMTEDLAAQQAPRNVSALRALLSKEDYHEVFVFAGQIYLAALQPIEAWLPRNVKLTLAGGGIGRKVQRMREWLLERRCDESL